MNVVSNLSFCGFLVREPGSLRSTTCANYPLQRVYSRFPDDAISTPGSDGLLCHIQIWILPISGLRAPYKHRPDKMPVSTPPSAPHASAPTVLLAILGMHPQSSRPEPTPRIDRPRYRAHLCNPAVHEAGIAPLDGPIPSFKTGDYSML